MRARSGPPLFTRRRALALLGLVPAAVVGNQVLTSCEDAPNQSNAAERDRREAAAGAAEAGPGRGGARNVKNPEFGAAGDGKTDDTAAIQAAIDSLPSDETRGGTVIFPTGHYKITSPLRIYGRSTRLTGLGGTSAIESAPGYGSVLQAAEAGMTLLEIGDDKEINQFGPVLEDLSFTAASEATGVTLVKNRSTIQTTFKNCYFRRAETGVRFTSWLSEGGLGDSGWAYLEQCFFYELENGLLGENDDPEKKLSNQFVLVGGGFTNCTRPIKIASGSGGARIFGPKINNAEIGIEIGGGACQVFAVHTENCRVGVSIDSDGVSPGSGEANFLCGGVIVGYDGPSGEEIGVRVGPGAKSTTVMNTGYVNLGTDLLDEGASTLHMPIGGPIVLGGAGDALRFEHQGNRVASVRAENGLLFDMRGGDEHDGFAINLPGSSSSSLFEVRNGDGDGICSVSGDGTFSIEKGRLLLGTASSEPTEAGSGGTLFTRQNGEGKTELCVRFGAGAELVLATEP